MSQASLQQDWRKKYFDSIRAIEEDARAHRARLVSMYRLAGRLCAAAQGHSPRVDAQLKPLRDALRRQAEGDELDRLGSALADAVRESDAENQQTASAKPVSADTSMARIPKFQEVLMRLLSELRQEADLRPEIDALQSGVLLAPTDDQLADAFAQVGGWLTKRIRHLEKERDGLAVLIDQMVGQLDSLNSYVKTNAEEESRRSSSHDALNQQVNTEVREMGETVMNGTDLETLRAQLSVRLDSIGRHMRDFREREEEHSKRSRERAARMQARMAEMENEARDLQARLSDEQRQSLLDALTRIPNRAAWDKRFEEEISRWPQDRKPVCVLAWDVDHFKSINDKYGHRAGDKVLVVVAESLAAGIRGTDFVARYGGEEFAMVLPGTSLANAVVVADQVRCAISETGFHFRGSPVSVTISCGITELKEGDTADEAFERADRALYKAKNSGRNRVVRG